ncbi:hypothetical protein D3C78_1189790 [compost metagenome]
MNAAQAASGAIRVATLMMKAPLPRASLWLMAVTQNSRLAPSRVPHPAARSSCERLGGGSRSQASGNSSRAASRKRLPIKAAVGSSRIASFEKSQPAAASRVTSIISSRGARFIGASQGQGKGQSIKESRPDCLRRLPLPREEAGRRAGAG